MSTLEEFVSSPMKQYHSSAQFHLEMRNLLYAMSNMTVLLAVLIPWCAPVASIVAEIADEFPVDVSVSALD
jgi:hypothetical protein